MTPEAQRIAIAKACGWTKVGSADQMIGQRPGTPFASSYAESLPNYLTDLNAMHEAEKVLPDLASDDTGVDQLGYCETLASVIGAQWTAKNAADMWMLVHATAAQRAEAFIRTIGKWEDDK